MSLIDPTSPAAKAHRTRTLNSRKVVDFLRANPGATSKEIYAATGFGPTRLQRVGMAEWKRGEDKVVRWYLTGEMARPWEDNKT